VVVRWRRTIQAQGPREACTRSHNVNKPRRVSNRIPPVVVLHWFQVQTAFKVEGDRKHWQCNKKADRNHLKRNSAANMQPAFLAKITDIRRTIHAHPELGFEEYGTQKLVRDELLAAGVPEAAIRTCAKTGLVVDIIGTYGMTVVAFSVNSLDIRHGLNVQGTSWGRWRAAVAGNSRGHGRFAVD
jgi:hypothetical protein